MTTQEFEASVDSLMQECLTVMNKTKGVDYTSGDDRLTNFKTIGEETGLEPLQVWMVWTGKHWDAIRRAIQKNPRKPTKVGEPLRENFKDLIVYAFLGNALLEEANRSSHKK